jgi:betaine reductase
MERAGLPAVVISAMTSVAKASGANRILVAGRIPHPVGDPSLPPQREQAYRRQVVEAALAALTVPVTGPTAFEPEQLLSAR